MCLAVLGRILTVEEKPGIRIGKVQFGGIIRSAYREQCECPRLASR